MYWLGLPISSAFISKLLPFPYHAHWFISEELIYLSFHQILMLSDWQLTQALSRRRIHNYAGFINLFK